MFLWSSSVRRWWDGFSTRVCIDRCAWVLLVHPFMPYVRLTLLETQSEQCLSARGKALGTLDRGPGSLPRGNDWGEKGRQVVKSCPPALNHRVENWWRGWSSRFEKPHGQYIGLIVMSNWLASVWNWIREILVVLPHYPIRVENRVCLSRGVQETGATW
jgi:hypothetical protein